MSQPQEERQVFAQLVQAHSRSMYRAARALLDSDAAAESGEELAEKLRKITPGTGAKKQRVLRPAVSAKDSRVEKTEQPLRTVRRKIDLTAGNPEALSKKVVEELAVRIANSRVK